MIMQEAIIALILSVGLSLAFIQEKLNLSQELAQLEHQQWVHYLVQEAFFAWRAGRMEWLERQWQGKVSAVLPLGEGAVLCSALGCSVKIQYQLGAQNKSVLREFYFVPEGSE